MLAFLALPALALATLARAEDWRILVNKPSCTSMEAFQANFAIVCPHFQLTQMDDYEYQGMGFTPGDYSGNNKDSQALVYCTFTMKDGSIQAGTDAVLAQLGGTTGTTWTPRYVGAGRE